MAGLKGLPLMLFAIMAAVLTLARPPRSASQSALRSASPSALHAPQSGLQPAPRSEPGLAPKSTPQSALQPAPLSARQSAPRSAPQLAPQSANTSHTLSPADMGTRLSPSSPCLSHRQQEKGGIYGEDGVFSQMTSASMTKDIPLAEKSFNTQHSTLNTNLLSVKSTPHDVPEDGMWPPVWWDKKRAYTQASLKYSDPRSFARGTQKKKIHRVKSGFQVSSASASSLRSRRSRVKRRGRDPVVDADQLATTKPHSTKTSKEQTSVPSLVVGTTSEPNSSRDVPDGRCPPLSSPRSFTDSEGRIEWAGEGMAVACAWLIDMSSAGLTGLVLQFDDLGLQRGAVAAEDDTLTIYTGRQPSPAQEVRQLQGSLPLPPLVVKTNYVLLQLEAHGADSSNRAQNPKWVASRFSIGYRAYGASSLPAVDSDGLYDCGCPQCVVPHAMRCDMVPQCRGQEDELNFNCDYTHSDCGRHGGKPLGGDCYSLYFIPSRWQSSRPSAVCDHTLLVSLGYAPVVYPDHFITSAELPTQESRQLAARLLSLSGVREAIVDLMGYQQFTNHWPGHLYRFMWIWRRSVQLELSGPRLPFHRRSNVCAKLVTVPTVHLEATECLSEDKGQYYLCSMQKMSTKAVLDEPKTTSISLTASETSWAQWRRFRFTECSDGSRTHFQCPSRLELEDSEDGTFRHDKCLVKPMFYTMTCDGSYDCALLDTDEQHCSEVQQYLNNTSVLVCELPPRYAEVQRADARCNGMPDCPGSTWFDEADCTHCPRGLVLFAHFGCLPPHYADLGLPLYGQKPAEVDLNQYWRQTRNLMAEDGLKLLELDGYGYFTLTLLDTTHCPHTHFHCSGLCVPVYVLNNGIADCPYPLKEDEGMDVQCPGYYRCQGMSQVCVHAGQLCDGVYHCPAKDDEKYCDCPDWCVCRGLEYTCYQMVDVTSHVFLRSLDLSHVPIGVLPRDLFMPYMRELVLSWCGLTHVSVSAMPLLQVLDLSYNGLTSWTDVVFTPPLKHLERLDLSGNPLVQPLHDRSFYHLIHKGHETLRWLALSKTKVRQIKSEALSKFRELRHLDLSDTRLRDVDQDTFDGLGDLEALYLGSQRLCCLYWTIFPRACQTCWAPVDELSSCSDLLRSAYNRTMLWLLSLMAVGGNVVVFVYRVFGKRTQAASGFEALVTNLCVSDLLMGVYMVMIGAADARYSGRYLWQQEDWMDSVQCRVAGFLALLSSQVSAFHICLITLDRFLALRFPFRAGLHLTGRRALLVSALAWGLGAILAGVPLLPATRHWHFYSQTGICLPLPITRRRFPGSSYSFGIFIVLNFVLFLFVGAGQMFIYRAVRGNGPASGRQERRRRDRAIALRLFFVAVTDFCCWFPVGVMGLLAQQGVPIPGQFNVWAAIFVLPLNSALNPFLYTLYGLHDKLRKKREEKRVQEMMKNLHAEVLRWPEQRVRDGLLHFEAALKRFPSSQPSEAGQSTVQEEVNNTEVNRGSEDLLTQSTTV